MGRILPPAILGKAADFGGEGAKCRKLHSIREYEISGQGKLPDHAQVHSIASGFFDTRVYAEYVWSAMTAAIGARKLLHFLYSVRSACERLRLRTEGCTVVQWRTRMPGRSTRRRSTSSATVWTSKLFSKPDMCRRSGASRAHSAPPQRPEDVQLCVPTQV
mmetsp:Transcript_127915/g.409770  ORF Transcript_127915/g.409770 Transcript_127915/m.409770 type:complete len:161 (-) Transcript_127915:575-1057(-)